MPDTERVEYIISLRDKATKGLTRMTKAVNTNDRAYKKLGQTITRFISVAAIGAILKNSVQKMIEFEKAASNLSAITGATGDDLEYMKQKALEMAGATTMSAKETIEGFKLIASAKPELLTNAAALSAVTKEAITLAEASGLTLPEAAKALTGALNQFDLSADQSSRVINVLAAGSKFAAAEIPDLTASLEEFGGVAQSMNLSVEQSAAAVETLSAKNLKGARAGIQLRNVLLKLGSSTDSRVNPKIVGLSTALENLSGIQDNTTELTKMFGRQNVLAAQTLIKNRKRVDELTKSMTGTNIAYEQARINTDNLAGDFDRLSSSWEVLVINMNKGEGVISTALRNITTFATKFIEKLSLMNKSQKELNESYSSERMQEFVEGNKAIKTRDELFGNLVNSISEVRKQNARLVKDAEKLGGIKKVMKAGEGQLGNFERVFQRQKLLEKETIRDMILGNNEYIDKVKGILGDETKLAKLLNKFTPKEVKKEDETPFKKFEGFTTDKKTKKHIATITGAAPKTFNINIENLVENMNINTENITEGSVEVKKQITMALAEALADVQPQTE